MEVSLDDLTLISSGSGDEEGRDKGALANVIFVHGLRGHPRRTWEYKQVPVASSAMHFGGAKTQPLVNNFWPADELGKVVPRANIFTYGYNADVIEGVFHSNNRNSISQHANDLMVTLELSLENELPIIFVAHSLGGIIVKAVIITV